MLQTALHVSECLARRERDRERNEDAHRTQAAVDTLGIRAPLARVLGRHDRHEVFDPSTSELDVGSPDERRLRLWPANEAALARRVVDVDDGSPAVAVAGRGYGGCGLAEEERDELRRCARRLGGLRDLGLCALLRDDRARRGEVGESCDCPFVLEGIEAAGCACSRTSRCWRGEFVREAIVDPAHRLIRLSLELARAMPMVLERCFGERLRVVRRSGSDDESAGDGVAAESDTRLMQLERVRPLQERPDAHLAFPLVKPRPRDGQTTPRSNRTIDDLDRRARVDERLAPDLLEPVRALEELGGRERLRLDELLEDGGHAHTLADLRDEWLDDPRLGAAESRVVVVLIDGIAGEVLRVEDGPDLSANEGEARTGSECREVCEKRLVSRRLREWLELMRTHQGC